MKGSGIHVTQKQKSDLLGLQVEWEKAVGVS